MTRVIHRPERDQRFLRTLLPESIQWMPPAPEVHCRYAAEWTATKLRWNLSADDTEYAALNDLAAACPDQTVTYTLAT